jgi:hypothetical protein
MADSRRMSGALDVVDADAQQQRTLLDGKFVLANPRVDLALKAKAFHGRALIGCGPRRIAAHDFEVQHPEWITLQAHIPTAERLARGLVRGTPVSD